MPKTKKLKKKRSNMERRNNPVSANEQLMKDLKRHVDRIIDILPKEDVASLFSRQLEKKDLGLRSYILDDAVSTLVVRGAQFSKKPFCKLEVGEYPDVRWALYRLDSEGETRFVRYISAEEAEYIDPCG